MRKSWLTILMVCLYSTTLHAAPPLPEPRLGLEEKVVEHTLKNGMKLLMVERHTSPTVSAWIRFRVGSVDEHSDERGIAHLLEHMLFKGTTTLGTKDYAAEKPILDRIEAKGFSIVGMKKIKLSREQAEGFYYVHKARPFFNDLCAFMSRSPVIVLCLEKENAIADWRTLMGATNPANAEPGTIRKDFAVNIEENSSHGSDAPETAAFEIPYFFSTLELV